MLTIYSNYMSAIPVIISRLLLNKLIQYVLAKLLIVVGDHQNKVLAYIKQKIY